jgi:hypothetical protein
MSDLLDSDGPDYDPEAYAEMIDVARKRERENPPPRKQEVWSHVGFIRHFGLWTWVQYERSRRRSERAFGRKYDPRLDGAPMLRKAGFSEAEIEHFREHGLA